MCRQNCENKRNSKYFGLNWGGCMCRRDFGDVGAGLKPAPTACADRWPRHFDCRVREATGGVWFEFGGHWTLGISPKPPYDRPSAIRRHGPDGGSAGGPAPLTPLAALPPGQQVVRATVDHVVQSATSRYAHPEQLCDITGSEKVPRRSGGDSPKARIEDSPQGGAPQYKGDNRTGAQTNSRIVP
jgi:hypothetical protein